MKSLTRDEATRLLRETPGVRVECADPSVPVDCGSWQRCWLGGRLFNLVWSNPDGNGPTFEDVPRGFVFRTAEESPT